MALTLQIGSKGLLCSTEESRRRRGNPRRRGKPVRRDGKKISPGREKPTSHEPPILDRRPRRRFPPKADARRRRVRTSRRGVPRGRRTPPDIQHPARSPPSAAGVFPRLFARRTSAAVDKRPSAARPTRSLEPARGANHARNCHRKSGGRDARRPCRRSTLAAESS